VGADGPKESCVDGGPDPRGKRQFWRKGAPIVKYRDTAVTCAKTAEPVVMPLGLTSQSGSRNHELDGGPDPPREGQYWGKESPIVKYRDFLP